MPKMNVSKSMLIAAKPEAVFSKINDFSQWDAWSPWNILEKGIQLKISEGNKFHEWEGDITGSGNMRITSEKENQSVYIDLTFLKPWKSKAKVDFQLTPEGEGTRVVWNMESSLPFFLFFMKKMMVTYIGMDFERGLLLLKDVAEDGEAHCKLDFVGNAVHDGGKYIGVHRRTTTDKAPEQMEADFSKLMEYAAAKENLINGNAFTVYNDWNLVKGNADFVSAVSVSEFPSDLPSGFVKGETPKTEVYTVRSQGPYHHIGNAWTSLEMRARSKKFKKNKGVKPMEVYLNSPKDTAPNELLTEIRMPRK